MRSKKLTKVLSLVLASAFVLSLAGCAKSTEKTAETNTTPTKEAATNQEATTAPVEETTDKTLADFDKVDQFNYYNLVAGITDEEFNASPLAKLVEDHTGYKVTYTQSPADATDMQTAITNIFMLKQDYQAVKVSKDQFYTLLAMDALLPITEYVNASTNLKEQISEFGWETAS